MVASDQPICSEIGNALIEQHQGNVVDAAVATALCIGVLNPSSSGIGGGAFILIHMHDASGTLDNLPDYEDMREDPQEWQNIVIDCRETAPAQSAPDMYTTLADDASTVGGLAIAIPAELKGLELAHARYGQLAWADVVQPSIDLATEGCTVGPYLAKSIQERAGRRWEFDAFRKQFTHEDGQQRFQEGDIIKNIALGQTLTEVAKHGTDVLYKGGLAKSLVQDIQAAGGIITEDDLANYKPTLRTPLLARDVAGHAIMGVPPPSSGGATVMGAARFLAGFDQHVGPPSQHRLVAAMRHAFAIRMSLSDPAYNTEVVKDAVNDLVYSDYMDKLRETTPTETMPLSKYGGTKWSQLRDADGDDISDAKEGDRLLRKRQRRRLISPLGHLEDRGTSHISVMDAKGNAVAITTTVNTYFGSGVLSESTGILLNNQMDDFSTPGRMNFFGLQPSEANYIRPGKKPLSSMAPTMVFSQGDGGELGKLIMTVGGSGGPLIISATLQALWNHVVAKMTVYEAVVSPRLHDQLIYHESASTLFEKTQLGKIQIEVPEFILDDLERRGHRLAPMHYAGCVQAIARYTDGRKHLLTGVSDIRKHGKPAGH